MKDRVFVVEESELRKAVRETFREELKKLRVEHENTSSAKELLSNREAMKYLGCSRSKLQRLRSSGELPYAKVGNSIYYLRADLLDYIDRHRSA